MFLRDGKLRLFPFLIIAAAGLLIASGCGDDDPVVNPPPPNPMVTMQLSATIETINDTNNLLPGAINVGDTIVGTYTYDLRTEDTNANTSVGMYRQESQPCGIFLEIQGYEFKTVLHDVDFLVSLTNDHGTPEKDHYTLHSYNNSPLSQDITLDTIAWQLDDDSATALTGIELTAEPPDLGSWTSDFGLTIDGGDPNNMFNRFFIRAHITSISKVD